MDNDIKTFLSAKTKKDHTPNNLSKDEVMALNSLTARHDITIKPADKEGAIVVMDTAKYELEVMKQLGNTNTYRH